VKPIIEEIRTSASSIDIFQSIKTYPFPFFLDSQMDPAKLGRFSFIGKDPFLVLKSKGDFIQLIEDDRIENITGNPFNVIKDIIARFPVDTKELPFPFMGGGVGYFSYDLKHHIEKLPRKAMDDIKLPDCMLGFYDSIIVIDHLFNKKYIISTGFPEKDEIRRQTRAKKRLELLRSHCEEAAGRRSNLKPEIASVAALPRNDSLKSNFKKEKYIEAIKRAKEYIASGDTYQINLSQRFTSRTPCDPYDLYLRLRDINPAPFAAFLDFGDFQLISASPERFLCLRDKTIHTRPIKGTRPRGNNSLEDGMLARELITSVKDRAEHLMIVDLERNDLGRVCRFGSVRPTEFTILEKYATVFHLVSTISGHLKKNVDAVDCLLNCFPGGSITGAPKIRSMEIIDELEPTQRSIYTGSIGYISFNGNMDTSIVIRTILVKGKKLYFQVGGGIVADSDPEAEYQETLDKAKALIDAITAKKEEVLA